MISASIAAIHARCSAPCRTHSVTRPQTRRHSSWQPCHTTSFRQPARLQRSNDRHQHSHRIRVAEIDAHPVHVCSAPAIDMVDYQVSMFADLRQACMLDVYYGLQNAIEHDLEVCCFYVSSIMICAGRRVHHIWQSAHKAGRSRCLGRPDRLSRPCADLQQHRELPIAIRRLAKAGRSGTAIDRMSAMCITSSILVPGSRRAVPGLIML